KNSSWRMAVRVPYLTIQSVYSSSRSEGAGGLVSCIAHVSGVLCWCVPHADRAVPVGYQKPAAAVLALTGLRGRRAVAVCTEGPLGGGLGGVVKMTSFVSALKRASSVRCRIPRFARPASGC